jgi:hypothetical protein
MNGVSSGLYIVVICEYYKTCDYKLEVLHTADIMEAFEDVSFIACLYHGWP